MIVRALAVFAVSLVACSPPAGEASLTFRISPQTVLQGEEATVVVTATAADGLLGRGTVRVVSEQGSLVDGIDLPLDAYGTASTSFVCPEPCTSPIGLSAKWGTVSVKANLPLTSGGTLDQCEVGSVTSLATPTSLDLFGTVLYFANGAVLPAGNYRLKNTGGCLKYGPGQNWCVHAYPNGEVAWWVVGETTDIRYFMPPGTYGFTTANRDVGYPDYAQCDAANRALPAHEFAFPGGKLGIWLKDLIYGDNTSGTGKNPSWTLTKVTPTCP